MENMESLNVLLSLLRPDWLKLKVVESLLCAYDDSLVKEEFRYLVAQPLSLKKVVCLVFVNFQHLSEVTQQNQYFTY